MPRPYGHSAIYDPDDDRSEFQDPCGRSSLRRAHKGNPRIHPCPACGAKRVLTAKDVALGYQCDRCADRDEGTFPSYES